MLRRGHQAMSQVHRGLRSQPAVSHQIVNQHRTTDRVGSQRSTNSLPATRGAKQLKSGQQAAQPRVVQLGGLRSHMKAIAGDINIRNTLDIKSSSDACMCQVIVAASHMAREMMSFFRQYYSRYRSAPRRSVTPATCRDRTRYRQAG